MNDQRFTQQMEFLAEIDKLKQVIRQTSLVDRSRQENTAEHSWHIAVMALVFSEYSNTKNVDLQKVLKMLLIHDLVEIYAGDTFVYDDFDKDEKVQREREAALKIFGLLPEDQAREFRDIWEEFEEEKTPEATYSKAIDAFQPVMQGYENKGWSWQTHGIGKSQILKQKESMNQGSTKLWDYTKELMDKAEEQGYLGDNE
ncbi:MAG: HD domain-containing protein [Candidatus Thorarchaeota archaeon]